MYNNQLLDKFRFHLLTMGGQGARRKRNWRHNRPNR